MTGLANGLGTNTLSSFGPIVHDGAGNRTSVTSSVTGVSALGGTTDWSYDNKDRLTGETSNRNGGWTAAFGYDNAGNLTNFKGNARTYNINNQLISGTGLGAFGYDGNGSATTHHGANISYDAEAHATLFGATTAPDMTAGYNSGGLRAWKQGAGGKTYFLYDGVAPIIEMNASGGTLATNTFGPVGLISRKVTGSSTGSTFYTFDERGNTVQRIDASGNVLSSHAYDAYGVALSLPSAPNDPFLYGGQAGYYTDGETGLVLCTLRYYDPQTARWLTRDPAGYAGGMNLYAYCYGNPTNALDPLGLCSSGGGSSPFADAHVKQGNDTNGGHGPDQWFDSFYNWANGLQAGTGEYKQKAAFDIIKAAAHLLRNTAYLGEGTGGGTSDGAFQDLLTAAQWPLMLTGIGGGAKAGAGAADDFITLFRGVDEFAGEAFAEAEMGWAFARGGHSNPQWHTAGDTRSIFTSWSESASVAESFATREGASGIILQKTFNKSQLIKSKNAIASEKEWLVSGGVTGAKPTKVGF